MRLYFKGLFSGSSFIQTSPRKNILILENVWKQKIFTTNEKMDFLLKTLVGLLIRFYQTVIQFYKTAVQLYETAVQLYETAVQECKARKVYFGRV